MTTGPDDAQGSVSHTYRTMRDFVQAMDDALPGKFEISKDGIVHDLLRPNGLHELTAARFRTRLEQVVPEAIVAHTGRPDVEDEAESVMRHPDVMLIAETDMEGEGEVRSTPVLSSPRSRSYPARTRPTTGSGKCATTP